MMQLHVVCQKGARWLRSVHDLADIAVQGARACDAAAAAHLYLTRVGRSGAALGAAAHLRVQGILGAMLAMMRCALCLRLRNYDCDRDCNLDATDRCSKFCLLAAKSFSDDDDDDD